MQYVQQKVLKAWEGLGYYSRARNLHKAAKSIVTDYDGKLPEDYDEIIKLKGIGPYTAAAITSIAFGKPNAVVDGNVIRVITRYFGIGDDIRSTRTIKQVQAHVNDLISNEHPADFNQGLTKRILTKIFGENFGGGGSVALGPPYEQINYRIRNLSCPR